MSRKSTAILMAGLALGAMMAVASPAGAALVNVPPPRVPVPKVKVAVPKISAPRIKPHISPVRPNVTHVHTTPHPVNTVHIKPTVHYGRSTVHVPNPTTHLAVPHTPKITHNRIFASHPPAAAHSAVASAPGVTRSAAIALAPGRLLGSIPLIPVSSHSAPIPFNEFRDSIRARDGNRNGNQNHDENREDRGSLSCQLTHCGHEPAGAAAAGTAGTPAPKHGQWYGFVVDQATRIRDHGEIVEHIEVDAKPFDAPPVALLAALAEIADTAPDPGLEQPLVVADLDDLAQRGDSDHVLDEVASEVADSTEELGPQVAEAGQTVFPNVQLAMADSDIQSDGTLIRGSNIPIPEERVADTGRKPASSADARFCTPEHPFN
jgi:hypothetical protein